MKYIKDITVLIMVVGLMGILGLIVVDEFQMANEHGGELDESVIGLLQMYTPWVSRMILFSSAKSRAISRVLIGPLSWSTSMIFEYSKFLSI